MPLRRWTRRELIQQGALFSAAAAVGSHAAAGGSTKWNARVESITTMSRQSEFFHG